MSNEIKDSVRLGLSERIKEELPGLTKAAHDMVVNYAMESIENDESIEAALALSGEGHEKGAAWKATPLLRAGSKVKGASSPFNWKEVGVKALGTIGGNAGTIATGLLSGALLHNYLQDKKNAELINQYADFQHTLATVTARNERLSNQNAERINEMGNSIFKFAPTIATDANVLETVLDNAVQYNGLDAQTVRALQELEERYHKLKEVPQSKNYMLG